MASTIAPPEPSTLAAAFKDQAQRRIDQTASLIAEVRAFIKTNETKLNAEAKAKAEAELDNAKKQLDDSKKLLDDGKFSESIIASANASGDAQRVKILVTLAVRTNNVFLEHGNNDGDIVDQDKLQAEIKSRVQDRLDEIFHDVDSNNSGHN